MPSSFQPDDPHPDTRGAATISKTSLATAIVSALMVIMVLAIIAPRAFGDNRWIITLGLGALTLVVVLAIGYFRKEKA